jgi:hypothetical protein
MDLEARILHLEKELGQWQQQERRLRRKAFLLTLGLGLLGGLLVWFVGMPVQAQPKEGKGGTIQGTSFVLVDEMGNKQAELASSEGSPLVTFFAKGKAKLIMGIKKGDPGMVFLQENGKTALQISASSTATVLSLRDAEGKTQAVLAGETAGGTLTLIDIKSKAKIELASGNRESKLRVLNAEGKQVWTAP